MEFIGIRGSDTEFTAISAANSFFRVFRAFDMDFRVKTPSKPLESDSKPPKYALSANAYMRNIWTVESHSFFIGFFDAQSFFTGNGSAREQNPRKTSRKTLAKSPLFAQNRRFFSHFLGNSFFTDNLDLDREIIVSLPGDREFTEFPNTDMDFRLFLVAVIE